MLYIAQIMKIHVHREVRDFSIAGFLSLALAYIILGYESYLIDSTLFLVKNSIAFCLIIIILGQIWYHRDDEWHDEDDASCISCENELDTPWKFCPDCGQKINLKDVKS